MAKVRLDEEEHMRLMRRSSELGCLAAWVLGVTSVRTRGGGLSRSGVELIRERCEKAFADGEDECGKEGGA